MTTINVFKSKCVFLVTLLVLAPAIASGTIIGLLFINAFWYWAIGISGLVFFYICLDRVPLRLFAGAMRGLPFWQLLKYGYASTDNKPMISSEMVNEENEWRSVTYNHFYGDDR